MGWNEAERRMMIYNTAHLSLLPSLSLFSESSCYERFFFFLSHWHRVCYFSLYTRVTAVVEYMSVLSLCCSYLTAGDKRCDAMRCDRKKRRREDIYRGVWVRWLVGGPSSSSFFVTRTTASASLLLGRNILIKSCVTRTKTT